MAEKRGTKKGAAGKSGRKYSKGAGRSVKRALHKEKHGTLKSGRSGKKVTDPKQAIAIGLSEARKKGEKVPPPKKSKKKAASRKGSTSKAKRKAATKK